MTRILRFRAWFDKKPTWCNRMFYSEEEGTLGDWFSECQMEHEDVKIMQYTGLKDKNGKEIYEGDIIRSQQWNPSIMWIAFVEGGFCAYYDKDAIPIDINQFYDSTGCAIMVKGNIYENPEILKKTSDER